MEKIEVELQVVDFEIAKELKRLGYSQKYYEECPYYSEEGELNRYDSEYEFAFPDVFCVAPTYVEVWFWLERVKHKWFYLSSTMNNSIPGYETFYGKFFEDPEDAIKDTVKYLFNNKLIQ